MATNILAVNMNATERNTFPVPYQINSSTLYFAASTLYISSHICIYVPISVT